MRYRMMPREGTCTFYKIMSGRKWVGRVYQHADGRWSAAIGKVQLSLCATSAEAFHEGVAKHLGYPSALALRQRNAAVRQVQRRNDQIANDAMRRFLSAKTTDERFAVLDKLTTPEALTGTLRAFTRELKRR